MAYQDRKEEILSILYKQNYVSVKELTKLLYVSEPTIRRDLSQLEKEGLLRRNRGGAILVTRDELQYPQSYRQDENVIEKKYIAKLATQLLSEYHTIFLDSSSSCYYLAQMMDDKSKIHVVTHGLLTAQELGKYSNIQVELVGGVYDPKNNMVCGPDANYFVQSRYADACFLSAAGIDLKQGFTCQSLDDTGLCRRYHQQSKKTIVLLDHSKFNKKYFIKLLDWSDVDIIVTDRSLPEELDNYCFKNNIEVIYE